MSDVRIAKVGAWLGGTVVDLASYGDVVLAATFAGIFRSTDRGRSRAHGLSICLPRPWASECPRPFSVPERRRGMSRGEGYSA